jgi:PTH1 family peptidyl-tRNA hydrolase
MPQTYMNNSGFAVREFRQRHEVALDDLLIVFDDFQLPFGTIRLRPKGSDGGHNGMASVIYQLESDLIPRLRLGVAGSDLPERRTHDTMADYVLSPFDASEKDRLIEFLLHAHDAASRWLEEGIERTMSAFNRNFFSDADAS